jgi:hypothetical protein
MRLGGRQKAGLDVVEYRDISVGSAVNLTPSVQPVAIPTELSGLQLRNMPLVVEPKNFIIVSPRARH